METTYAWYRTKLYTQWTALPITIAVPAGVIAGMLTWMYEAPSYASITIGTGIIGAALSGMISGLVYAARRYGW